VYLLICLHLLVYNGVAHMHLGVLNFQMHLRFSSPAVQLFFVGVRRL
jgi:hypothetical protein